MTASDTPIESHLLECPITLALYREMGFIPDSRLADKFRQVADMERALTAEREKSAKLREEVLEGAAKAFEANPLIVMGGAYIAKAIRAMKEKQ